MKIPFKVPTGLRPVITQPYGDIDNLAFYKSKGITIPFHNGVDLTTNGSSRNTYGCPVFAPCDGIVTKVYWEGGPVAANGNEVVFHTSKFEEGSVWKVLEFRFVHLSGVDESLEGKQVFMGAVLGYVGNSGLVSPAPTALTPYAGTHLHLGMIEYEVDEATGNLINKNEKNGVYGLLDPMTRINLEDFDTMTEDVTKDAPALQWGISSLKLSSTIDIIKYVWQVIFK